MRLLGRLEKASTLALKLVQLAEIAERTLLSLLISLCLCLFFLSGVGAIGYPAYVCHPEYT